MSKTEKYPLYVVNEEKKAVSCKIKSQGEFFVGVARCHEDDTFDVQKGKDIAFNRCRVLINKRILQSELETYDIVKEIIHHYEEQGLGKVRSKAWDNFLLEAKNRVDHRKMIIRQIEMKLNDLLE